MLSGMILAAFSLFPVLAFSAPSPASHQIVLSPEAHTSHGIPKVLFNDFNDLSKIIDITNCLQTPEGISYPFGCNSFCSEFPELKLLKQWNTADNLGDSYGYIAISHEKGKERIIIAFAGAYSFTNAVIDLSAIPEDYIPFFSGISGPIESCPGCKVHGDFYREWLKTEELIGAIVSELVTQYVLGMRDEHLKNIDGKNAQVAVPIAKKNPYQLVLVGHKLGGAVATLAAVEFRARGWNPQVTTFGQPKVGNEAFTDYLTGKFTPSTYRRVTHVSDPVPLFPPGFSHYEHEYFISKEFVPYTAADVRICNADTTCETHVDIGDTLDLNWEASDYFHHTDTCVREPASFFSFSTYFFIIELGNLGLEKRSNINPQFHSVLETIAEELEEEGEGSTTEFERSQSIWNKKNNQKRSIDPNTKLVKPIPDSKFAKTFAMVEPPPPKTPPEYEDEELYHAMSGFDKAQGMWVKPQKKAPVTKLQKRRTVDPDVSFVKPIPDSKFKKTFAMVEPLEPEPEEEVYVPQYEDEEIYNAMSGFKTAQSMWIKPKETPEKEKRNTYRPRAKTDLGTRSGNVGEPKDPENVLGVSDEEAPAERSPKATDGEAPQEGIIDKPEAIDEEGLTEQSPKATDEEAAQEQETPVEQRPRVIDGETSLKFLGVIGKKPPFGQTITIIIGEAPLEKSPKTISEETSADQPPETINEEAPTKEPPTTTAGVPGPKDTTEPKPTPKLKEPTSPESPQKQFPVLEVSFSRNITKPQEHPQPEKGSNLVTRGLDRALRFFHAPKEVLNAQLAANDRTAAYEAQQKAQQNPQSKLEGKPSETKTNTKLNEDYVKKGGSVLMLNGRPLEIDGRPVGSSIQKRSTGHRPGLGLRDGPKRGGTKRGGGGDKITKLSSSSPPTTKSNSRVGVIENAVPNSLEEEVVDVKKGGNFVLMNGRRMPSNFSRKSVSTKPTKRSYIPEGAERRLRDPEELGFSSVQQAQGRHSHVPEHEERPLIPQLMRKPKKHHCKPKGNFDATNPEHHFRRPEDHFHAPQEKFHFKGGHYEEAYIPGEHFIPDELFHMPEGKRQFAQGKGVELLRELLRFSTEEGFGVSEENFNPPDQNTYGEHIPGQWEMWDIQESRTGPFTHTWKSAREAYTGELPKEDGEVEYSYSS